MNEINTIDIEGKKLALSGRELNKLSSDEGCQLQLVTDRVLKLDDEFDDDYDSDVETILSGKPGDDLYDDLDGEMTKKAKAERMRREYISLVLNANNDPIKPGTKFRSQDIELAARETLEESSYHNFDMSNFDDKHLGIQRMYEDLGNYEEYMKKNKFDEITPGLVYKMIRISGMGEATRVTEDCLVIYNCALWTEGSKEAFDSTWLRRTTLMTYMASDSVLPGIRNLLLSAQQRELCEAFIRPEAAFGALGAMPRIPANATVFCLLEVVRVVPQDKIAKLMRTSSDSAQNDNDDVVTGHLSQLKFEDFYEASDEARRRGNYYYEHDQYKVALQRYKSAIRLLEGYSYQNEQQEHMANELLVKLFNNCARTSNVMGNPRGALAACKQARLINDNVPKTHWHRMSAWAKKGHLDRALGVARRAVQLFPDPKTSKPFLKAAEDFKHKLQQEKSEVDELHRLMGRALLSSA